MSKLSLEVVLLFFVILTPTGEIFARAAGSLDASFGAGGIALVNIGNGGVSDIAVQADGKILVAGSDSSSFLIVRYNADGSLDSGFGAGGSVHTQIFAVDNLGGGIYGLAIQPDGKIVAVGYGTRGRFFPKGSEIFTEVAITRYNPNGSPDTSFDDDGKLTTLINNNSGVGENVALQTDGKIVIAAWNSVGQNNFVMIRLNTNGTLDNSFDGDGMAITPFDTAAARTQDVKIQPDGKILVAGYYQPGSGSSFALARYNPDGSLDNSFGVGGKATAGFNGSDYAFGMTLQTDGKIIVVGATQLTISSPQHLGLIRLNADGSYDNTFDGDGRVTTIFNTGGAGMDVVVQPDGRIIAAGIAFGDSATRDFAVARYLPNGTLDNSFDGDGKLTTPILGEDRGMAVALQTNGKILVAGDASGSGTGVHTAVVRYNSRADAFCDFDGDGRADISVFRPSGGTWYISNSSNNAFTAIQFGANGDLIAPADFDGDGKTDVSVFRPTDGGWYRLNSSNNTFSAAQFGANGDLPAPGDFDGDGRADISVFRPSAGSWYRVNSSNNQFVANQFGANGDKPIGGDFDGDGKTDLAVFRPADGGWYRIHSSNGAFAATQFGTAEDKPVAADFDGDGKTDLAVYRPSAGSWYRLNSSNGQFIATQFGIAEDKPAPADFDGDGKADLAVFRPTSGTWYLLRSTTGFTGIQFGANSDVPTPNAFIR